VFQSEVEGGFRGICESVGIPAASSFRSNARILLIRRQQLERSVSIAALRPLPLFQNSLVFDLDCRRRRFSSRFHLSAFSGSSD